MGFWIRLYFFLRLRPLVNWLQRLVKGELWAKRAPLPTFDTPEELERYALERFEWRADGSRLGRRLFIPLDYVTHPEVFQARLEDGVGVDGDCDDLHHWAAHVLPTISGVTKALALSVVWKGGGHTVTLYECRGHWYMLNYKISGPLQLTQAVQRVLDWKAAKEDGIQPTFRWYVAETIDFELISSTPGAWSP